MERARWWMTAALVLVLAAGGVMSAQGPGGRGRGGAGPPGGGAPGRGIMELRGLNLSDGQREQVSQLRQQYQEQTRTLVERMRAAQEARRKVSQAVPVNEAQLRAAMQELSEVQTELAVFDARLRADIWSLLSADQQAQLERERAEREARLSENRERVRQRQGQQQ